MAAVPASAARPVAAHRRWIPRQHGAWAMLLLPVLLGVAASRPAPWQLVVAVAALAAYLASATAQAWQRARRPREYRLPIVAYSAVAAAAALALLVAHPALALGGVVIVPAGALVLRGAQPGTRRDLANSLLQVVQSLVLVPVAAWVSGSWDPARVVACTAVAAGYQLGVVLVVRSVLRERGNAGFRALSGGFHLALVAAAAVTLPAPYVALAAALATRAIALPIAQERMAGGPRPLRPVHVGIVEMAASVAVVVIAFLAPAGAPARSTHTMYTLSVDVYSGHEATADLHRGGAGRRAGVPSTSDAYLQGGSHPGCRAPLDGRAGARNRSVPRLDRRQRCCAGTRR
jgi:hypothetical protein